MLLTAFEDSPFSVSHIRMAATAPIDAIMRLVSITRAGIAQLEAGCDLPHMEDELSSSWVIRGFEPGAQMSEAHLEIQPSDDVSMININAGDFWSIAVSLAMPGEGVKFSECDPRAWMRWLFEAIVRTSLALKNSDAGDPALVGLIRDAALTASARWGRPVGLTAPFLGTPALVLPEHIEAPEEYRWFVRLGQSLPNTVQVRIDDNGLAGISTHFHITPHVEFACAEAAGAVDTLRAVARIETLLQRENPIK